MLLQDTDPVNQQLPSSTVAELSQKQHSTVLGSSKSPFLLLLPKANHWMDSNSISEQREEECTAFANLRFNHGESETPGKNN